MKRVLKIDENVKTRRVGVKEILKTPLDLASLDTIDKQESKNVKKNFSFT